MTATTAVTVHVWIDPGVDEAAAERHRRSLRATRDLATRVVNRQQGVPPDRPLHIRRRPGHGPWVNSFRPVQFSIAHTVGGGAVVATDGVKCGVDIESLHRCMCVERVLAAAYTDAERRVLSALDHDCRCSSVRDRWLLKEAYGKALGVGIGLRERCIGFDITRRTISLERPDTRPWTFCLATVDGTRVAVAVAADPRRSWVSWIRE